MKRKSCIFFGIFLVSILAMFCYFHSPNLWMIVYLEEALSNTLHPYCPPLAPNAKPLLPAGTSLEASTRFATLQIESLDDQTRRYRWRRAAGDSWDEEVVKLKGGDGRNLNYPGNRAENIWTFVGLRRNVIAFEGVHNCKTETELDYWLKNYQVTHGAVYGHNGLVVGCRPDTPDFQIVQLMLNGQIPKTLHGAQGRAINMSEGKHFK